MHVCLISTEIFGFGHAGGYGFATRSLGRELVKRGVKVTVIIPQPRNTNSKRMEIEGFEIFAYPRLGFRKGIELFRSCNADIYHSQEPSLGTYLAQRAHPDKVHFVTSRDPRVASDWIIEFQYPTHGRLQVIKTCAYYENPLTWAAVRHAHGVYVPAHFLVSKVQKKYRLPKAPEFLPTPIPIPDSVQKAEQPTACYVGRLDRRKRPDRILDLARCFPDVNFMIAGRSQDVRYGAYLENEFNKLSNVKLLGFINQFEDNELSRLLEKSWILVNTSPREGLPNSYIEACGHRCAILSPTDPDGFATRFGMQVRDNDFSSGLANLLKQNKWQSLGKKGYEYVRETNDAPIAVQKHLDLYTSWI